MPRWWRGSVYKTICVDKVEKARKKGTGVEAFCIVTYAESGVGRGNE